MSSHWRRHKCGDGREWSTFSDSPSDAYLMVPVDQIEGLSAEEIGSRVLGLIEHARVTDLLNWTESYHNSWFEASRRDTAAKNKYAALCIRLPISDEVRRFREYEELKHLDPVLQAAYDEICAFIDETLNYLRTKKSRLTPNQTGARKIMLELRRGCGLCGLVEGKHTASCQSLQTHRRTDASSLL